MLYVQLDTNWPDHPKIISAGIEGAGLHAIVLCLAKRLERDGWVDRVLLYRQGATDDLIDRLVELDLLEDGDQAVRPDGWLDRNPSQAAIDAARRAKKEAGKKGNHDRWLHPGDFETCPRCHPNPQVVAECEAVGSDRIASDRTPTKSKSEVATRIAGAILEPPPIEKIPQDAREQGLAAVAALKQRHLSSVTANPKPAAGAVSVPVHVSAPLTNGDAG